LDLLLTFLGNLSRIIFCIFLALKDPTPRNSRCSRLWHHYLDGLKVSFGYSAVTGNTDRNRTKRASRSLSTRGIEPQPTNSTLPLAPNTEHAVSIGRILSRVGKTTGGFNWWHVAGIFGAGGSRRDKHSWSLFEVD
jgi:hypothetical protein